MSASRPSTWSAASSASSPTHRIECAVTLGAGTTWSPVHDRSVAHGKRVLCNRESVQLAIVAQRRTATNVGLAAAAPRGVDARILSPHQAAALLQPGAVAVGRLDVSDGLDGVEDGLWALGSLAARTVRVLNRAGALLAAHDKLLTAKVLHGAALPHPR